MEKDLRNKIKSLLEKTKAEYLDSKSLYKGKFIEVIEEKYLLPNNVIMPRERIIKNNDKESVIIIPITIDNKYLLVTQNRINEITTLEFPSGYIEENESIIEAGTRELLEETGYYSDNIQIIDTYYTSLGIDSSLVHIVIAYDAIKIKEQNLGKYEFINYAEFTFEELQELIKEDYIKGVGNKLAFYEVLSILEKEKSLTRKL